jgi:hypothetical protein
VARDEALAEAEARDVEQDRKYRDSEATIGRLRDQTSDEKAKEKLLIEATKGLRDSKRDSRKRKRLPGEDDTDRDLRHAKDRTTIQDKGVVKMRPTDDDAPLVDRQGNISLFPESSKKERRSEISKEKARQKEAEETHGTHLTDALGRKGSKSTWYLDKDGAVKDSQGRDVWGNEDPRRQQRQSQRMTSADPLAFMKKAQVQLKEVQRERESRETELRYMKSRQDDDIDDIDDFSLEKPTDNRRRESSYRHKDKKRHKRDRHESYVKDR